MLYLSKHKKTLRIIALLAVLIGLVLYGKFSGITDQLSLEYIREKAGNGSWKGMGVFTLLYTAGLFLNIPGFLFLIAAVLIYGYGMGIVIGYVSSFIAVMFSFNLIRMIGGQALAEVKNPKVRKLMSKIEDEPVKTVIALRTLLMVAPPVNYALALSAVSNKDHVLGTLIGLVFPVCGFVILMYFFSDIILPWFT